MSQNDDQKCARTITFPQEKLPFKLLAPGQAPVSLLEKRIFHNFTENKLAGNVLYQGLGNKDL